MHTRQWNKVIKNKIQNLEKHKTWQYNNLLNKRKVVKFMWVFKIKYVFDNRITCYKARLMA